MGVLLRCPHLDRLDPVLRNSGRERRCCNGDHGTTNSEALRARVYWHGGVPVISERDTKTTPPAALVQPRDVTQDGGRFGSGPGPGGYRRVGDPSAPSGGRLCPRGLVAAAATTGRVRWAPKARLACRLPTILQSFRRDSGQPFSATCCRHARLARPLLSCPVPFSIRLENHR